MWCNVSSAIPMKGNGQGDLALSEDIIKEFHSYITTRSNNNPLNFFITADHNNVFIEIRKNTTYKGISGSGPIVRNKKKCEHKFKQECFLFANQRVVVWNNGINPIDNKNSKIKRKSSYDELIVKLNELGFIGKIKSKKKVVRDDKLQLSDRSARDFIKYILGKNNKVPQNFYITLDGHYSTYWYCQTGNCTTNVKKELSECKKSAGRICKLFAKGRYVKWKNGINLGKGKASKFSNKMTDAQIYAKLTELGFYNNKKKIIETKEQKAAKEKKLAEEKAAKEKKLAEQKAAKEKKLAEQKAAKEKLDRKISLIPAETDLEKAQNFLKNLQEFIKLYPDEFDIIKVSEFFILTRPILDGDLNYKSKKDIEQFKEFTNTSNLFIKYNNDIEKNKRVNKLNKINDAVSNLENNIKIIKGFLVTDPNSIYLEEWLNSIKNAELIIDNPSSYDQLLKINDDLVKLTESKSEIDEVIAELNNNIDELKEILKQNLTSDLAPLLVEQAKLLETTIKKQILKDMNLANSAFKDFIYKNIIEPEEKRIAKEKRIAEEKRLEEIKIIEQKAAEEKKIAEETRIAEIKDKYNNLSKEQINFIKLLEDTKLKEISTDSQKALVLTKRNGVLQKTLNSNIIVEHYEIDGSKCKKPNDTYSFCKKIGTISINNWIGIVHQIGSNVDGSFYPNIAMPSLNDINKKTKNYLKAGSTLMMSNSGYNYLIKPSNKLYEIVGFLEDDNRILFSGEFFIDEDTDYIATEEFSKKNQIKKPTFTFRFTAIEKINLN